MDRRSFILSLIGGAAAASVGAVTMAQAAQTGIVPAPIDAVPADQVLARSVDETDAEYTRHRRWHRRHYRHRGRMRRMRRPDRRTRPNSGR